MRAPTPFTPAASAFLLAAGLLLGAFLPGGVSAARAQTAPEAASPASPEGDPFYTSLLDSGIRLYGARDYEYAARNLRVACFGLLEQPFSLGRCLIYLGAAQGHAGDSDGVTETFRRLSEVEQLFRGYSRASAPFAVRNDLKAALAREIPIERLNAVPAFADVAEWKEASRLALLSPRDRRRELEERRDEEPGNSRWPLMLADLELAENNAKKAQALADDVIARDPSSARARCTRGLARARQRDCSGAADDLALCPRSREEAVLAEAFLGCQVRLGRLDAARYTVAELIPGLADDPRLAPLVEQLRDALVTGPGTEQDTTSNPP